MDGLELSAGYFDDGDEAENDTLVLNTLWVQ